MNGILFESNLESQVEIPDGIFQQREHWDAVLRTVHERTSRMIHDLQIDIQQMGVVISGRTPAYYYKQLASQILLRELTGTPLVNDIEVI